MTVDPDDKTAIDSIIAAFFRAFDNASGAADLDSLRDLCLPDARIARAGGPLETLEAFVEPRRRLLASGAWTDFEEREAAEVTTIVMDCAQRTSRYRKRWLVDGVEHTGAGHKMFHLVRTPAGWRIASVLWQDAQAR